MARPRKPVEEKILRYQVYLPMAQMERLKLIYSALRQGYKVYIEGEDVRKVKAFPAIDPDSDIFKKPRKRKQTFGVSPQEFYSKMNIPMPEPKPKPTTEFIGRVEWQKSKAMVKIYRQVFPDERYGWEEPSKLLESFILEKVMPQYQRLKRADSDRDINEIMTEIYDIWRKENG